MRWCRLIVVWRKESVDPTFAQEDVHPTSVLLTLHPSLVLAGPPLDTATKRVKAPSVPPGTQEEIRHNGSDTNILGTPIKSALFGPPHRWHRREEDESWIIPRPRAVASLRV